VPAVRACGHVRVRARRAGRRAIRVAPRVRCVAPLALYPPQADARRVAPARARARPPLRVCPPGLRAEV
jgi:hypothetical protein